MDLKNYILKKAILKTIEKKILEYIPVDKREKLKPYIIPGVTSSLGALLGGSSMYFVAQKDKFLPTLIGSLNGGILGGLYGIYSNKFDTQNVENLEEKVESIRKSFSNFEAPFSYSDIDYILDRANYLGDNFGYLLSQIRLYYPRWPSERDKVLPKLKYLTEEY